MKQIIIDNIKTNYYISEDGKCYNINTGKYLKGQISNSGYLNFQLTLPNNVKKRYYAHRLVAIAYIENKNNLAEVNHKDGNKLNNNIENLEWVSSKDNIKHSFMTGLRPKNVKTVYCYNKELELVKIYPSINSVKQDGFSPSLVKQELYKKEKILTLGYYWNSCQNNNFKIITIKTKGSKTKVQQLDLEDNIINTYSSLTEAAKAIQGNHSHISECCAGKIKTYKGYKWRKILE